MGVRAYIREEVQKESVTKIHRQPMDQDLTILEKELITIFANIPTTLGGGNHGHAGVIIAPAKYSAMTGGMAFENLTNPGHNPDDVPRDTSAHAKKEVEHKEKVKEYKTFHGVMQATKDIILKAVDHKYLLEIKDEILGFLNQTPTDMLNHLWSHGGAKSNVSRMRWRMGHQ
jgi:hypothetical protein